MFSIRRLIQSFLLLLPLAAAAQSQLPPCPASEYRHNCVSSAVLSPSFSFEGEFQNNMPHGRGIGIFSNGEKYVGEFKDGKRNGQGIYTWLIGARYVGEWRDNKRNGQGTLTLANGDKYVGEWRDGQLNGQGTHTFANGDKYVGEFKDNKRNGQGTFTFASGNKYVGEYKDNKRDGQGTFTFASGNKYVGEWKDGKQHGQGIEYRADGTIIRSGRWVNDDLAQSLALDRSRFPFDRPLQAAVPPVDPGRAERERLAAEAEAAKRRQQELEQRLAAESERQAAEVEAARRRQQALEAQLAAIQSQGSPRPSVQLAVVRNAHALVIGNAAYPGSMRLANPVNDANAISQKLRSLGFTVTTVTDMNRQRLVQAMTQFRRSAASADLSLLFYAGHGVQIFGTNYILPTDVDQSDVAQATIQGVSLNSVLENFLPGKTKLVFLDACRDNPLMNTGDRSVSRGLAPISVAQGTLISYATKDGQTASDGFGSRNSPFTTALLEHLGDPSDIAVVLRKVREKVMQATGGKQQPWEYGSLTGGELVLSAIRPSRN